MDKTIGLFPAIAEAVGKVLARLDEQGSPCVIESGYRSFEEQQKLYDLGRTARNPDGATGAIPLGDIITNAAPGYSWHNFGLAVDLTRLDKNGKRSWDLPYKPIGDAGKEFGFEWGGDWASFKDLPHLQMCFGYKLKNAREIVAAVGLQKFWERIEQKDWA